MGLNLKDCIRIDYYMSPYRVKTNRKPIPTYVFKCKTCDGEARCRNSYLKKHSGLCIKCSARKLLKKAIEKRRLRPFESIYNYVKSCGKKCDLTYEDFLEFTKITNCHYCKSIINWKNPYGQAYPYNLDRKNNNLSYIKSNLVVCCGWCNKIKGDRFTYSEFMLVAPVLEKIGF